MRYAGIIRKYIGDAGTLIVVCVLMIPSLAVVYLCDWHFLTMLAFRKIIGLLSEFMDNYSRARSITKQKQKENEDTEKEYDEMQETADKPSDENTVPVIRPGVPEKDSAAADNGSLNEENEENPESVPDDTLCDDDSSEQNADNEKAIKKIGRKTLSKLKSLFSPDKIR